MRTIKNTYNVYKFNELTEEAQGKAIANLFDINTDDDWWESVKEDAENVGLIICAFDIYRGAYCELEYIKDFETVCKAIIAEHGENSDTYKEASQALEAWQKLYNLLDDPTSDTFDIECDMEVLETETLYNLGECYLSSLRQEYEYITSEEAIKEKILINEYEFLENGEIA